MHYATKGHTDVGHNISDPLPQKIQTFLDRRLNFGSLKIPMRIKQGVFATARIQRKVCYNIYVSPS